jgi:hypothetical protein
MTGKKQRLIEIAATRVAIKTVSRLVRSPSDISVVRSTID